MPLSVLMNRVYLADAQFFPEVADAWDLRINIKKNIFQAMPHIFYGTN